MACLRVADTYAVKQNQYLVEGTAAHAYVRLRTVRSAGTDIQPGKGLQQVRNGRGRQGSDRFFTYLRH